MESGLNSLKNTHLLKRLFLYAIFIFFAIERWLVVYGYQAPILLIFGLLIFYILFKSGFSFPYNFKLDAYVFLLFVFLAFQIFLISLKYGISFSSIYVHHYVPFFIGFYLLRISRIDINFARKVLKFFLIIVSTLYVFEFLFDAFISDSIRVSFMEAQRNRGHLGDGINPTFFNYPFIGNFFRPRGPLILSSPSGQFFLFLCLFLFATSSQLNRRYLYILIAGLLVFISGSKSAYFVFLFSLFLILLIKYKNLFFVLIPLFVVIFFLLFDFLFDSDRAAFYWHSFYTNSLRVFLLNFVNLSPFDIILGGSSLSSGGEISFLHDIFRYGIINYSFFWFIFFLFYLHLRKLTHFSLLILVSFISSFFHYPVMLQSPASFIYGFIISYVLLFKLSILSNR